MGLLSRLFTPKSMQSVPRHGWMRAFGVGFQDFAPRANQDNIHSFFAVFACVSKIAHDISKLPLLTKVKQKDIWVEKAVAEYLIRPNPYQTVQQFFECWLSSKLLNGNAYIYKQRDIKGSVNALYVLNADLVQPMIDETGAVWYQVGGDKLANIPYTALFAAEDIIHDRWNCFYHPLVGLPPIMACNIAAGNGLAIQESSRHFFSNRALPSGILTAPGHIDREKAQALAQAWNDAYSNGKIGKTAVLGDGMSYQQLTVNAVDSQLIEQLRLSAEIVCSAFHMPAFLIGFGSLPAGMKVSDLNELYYSGCLQSLIEAIEALLSNELGEARAEFDLHSLIRMDAQSQMQVIADGVKASVLTINEARSKQGLPAVAGGDTPYMQQQNYSLAALAKRDAQNNPFDPKEAA
jgi:phage portal protein, HK97 family